MANIIAYLFGGFVVGAVVIGVIIRAVLGAQKPPIITNAPTATASANAGSSGGGAAGGSVPLVPIVALVLLGLVAYLAVSTFQTIAQRVQVPAAEPAKVITAVPVATAAPVATAIPVTVPAPVVPRSVPVTAPAPAVPAWLVTAIGVLVLVAIAVYGTLAVLIARDRRRAAAGPDYGDQLPPPVPTYDRTPGPAPVQSPYPDRRPAQTYAERMLEYERQHAAGIDTCTTIGEIDKWEASIPDDIFNL